jgi:hypothetical protein
MQKINLLLANSERGLSNLLESVVLDACFSQAVVGSTRISRADELAKLGCSGAFQLVVLAADNLLAGPGLRSSWVSADQAMGAIRAIRERTATPIIAVTVFPENEQGLLEAGADFVLRLPLDNEKLKATVRQVLRMPEPAQEPEPAARWSLGNFVGRSLRRLKSA